MYIIIGAGVLTVLYILFGDLLEGLIGSFLSPVLILAFLTFFGAVGRLLETYTNWNSWLNLVLATSIALILDTLLNIFVLVPFKNTEQSLAISKESMVGRRAKVILAIPEDGFGEIIIESKTGRIATSAKSENGNRILSGATVKIINAENNGYVVVVPFEG